MFNRIKVWLLGGEFTLEDDGVVVFRFHQYGALELLWQRIRRSEDG